MKAKPEDAPVEVSNFLIGTSDAFSRLLSTRYWPKLDAAKEPPSAGRSLREAVKVSALAS